MKALKHSTLLQEKESGLCMCLRVFPLHIDCPQNQIHFKSFHPKAILFCFNKTHIDNSRIYRNVQDTVASSQQEEKGRCWLLAIGPEGTALSCIRKGSGWILGKGSLLRVVRHCSMFPRATVMAPSPLEAMFK